MKIETSRLILCKPNSNDSIELEKLWKNPEIRKYLGGILSDNAAKEKIIELQTHWSIYSFGQWVVFEKITQNILGLCGLHNSEYGLELSYMFFSKYWKQGFALEAAKTSIGYGIKNLPTQNIIAITQKTNSQSIRLLKNIGMSYVKDFKRYNAIQSLYKLKINSNS